MGSLTVDLGDEESLGNWEPGDGFLEEESCSAPGFLDSFSKRTCVGLFKNRNRNKVDALCQDSTPCSQVVPPLPPRI